MPDPTLAPVSAVRQRLRDFAAFIALQDPDALAEEPDISIDSTLVTVAHLQLFFARYSLALRRRQPQ